MPHSPRFQFVQLQHWENVKLAIPLPLLQFMSEFPIIPLKIKKISGDLLEQQQAM